MRVRTGYDPETGSPQWGPNTPSSAYLQTVRGSLVVGGPAAPSFRVAPNGEAARRARAKAERVRP